MNSRPRSISIILAGVLVFALCLEIRQANAQDAVEVSFGGLAGVTTAQPGEEVQLYFIELQDTPPPAGPRDARLRTAGPGTTEIRFSITDRTANTGLVAADIAALNFYRSDDAVFNGGDILLRSVVPGALGNQTINFDGPPIASPGIPDAPESIFFIITATISGGATPGHAFRFGVPGLHIDIRDHPPPGGPVDYALGTPIFPDDANYVLIQDPSATPPFSEPIGPIPVGLEWVAGLGFFAYGVYRLLQRGNARA